MPRPPRCRRICDAPQVDTFCPNGCGDSEPILLTLDEYEVIRLVDLEQQTHEQCAVQMNISRSTVQEIYESARRKIAACLVHGKSLHITGGNYRICGGQEAAHCGRFCLMQNGVDTLICGGIGGGAQAALAEAGIKLYGGVSGDADAAVNALLSGSLSYNPYVHCDHHDHEHGEEGHTCGDHGCGKHSCH